MEEVNDCHYGEAAEEAAVGPVGSPLPLLPDHKQHRHFRKAGGGESGGGTRFGEEKGGGRTRVH